MPKRADRELLTERVMPHVCRIVADEGVAAASIRRVADEAGMDVDLHLQQILERLLPMDEEQVI